MTEWRLADPEWLWLLAALPLVAWLRSRRGAPVLVVPFAARWHRHSMIRSSRLPQVLAYLGLALLALALARPQKVQEKHQRRTEGYDIILAIDLSLSMATEDYQQGFASITRLEAVQPVIRAFIEERPNDRIGMVIFSGRAYTLAPLTFDHEWLKRQAARLTTSTVPEEGTAIGDGLAVALTRLEQAARQQDARRLGAFVILLTDGANNRGTIAPLDAAEIAKSRAIPVYTIGAGRDGIGRIRRFDKDGNFIGYHRIRNELDEETLTKIAQMTGAQFFRAHDSSTVRTAFEAVDRAKKIKFEGTSYSLTEEYFAWVAVPGAFLWLLGALASRVAVARGARA
ncbi:MAG: VWA domain-containing protein [Verrucomicrobiae bacterium]|nr:VWA domain-containing protein [Verrucomicrobiae bacterium]